MLSKLSPRQFIIAFVVLSGAVVGGAINANKYFFGEGMITVFAWSSERILVNVDGKWADTVVAGGFSRVQLAQGKHAVKLASGVTEQTYDLDVTSGTFSRVLPFRAQCFALFDVTGAAYETGILGQLVYGNVSVAARYPGGAAFDFPGETYLSLNELPPRIQAGRRTRLLRPVACEHLEIASNPSLILDSLAPGAAR